MKLNTAQEKYLIGIPRKLALSRLSSNVFSPILVYVVEVLLKLNELGDDT